MGNLKDINAGVGKYLTTSDVPDLTQVTNNRVNIDNLNFKLATNNNYAKYDMLDGFIDAMQDTSGVDASASTNELRDSTGEYYSGSQPGNYFGSEADGALTTSGNVTLATAGSGDDRDMVVKNYSSLNIQSGHTMTVDNKCRGLFIYVSGNCTIAGTLHMNEKGAYDADPTQAGGSDNAAVNAAGLQLPMITSGGSQTLAAATFAGSGNTAVTAVANQGAISSNGTIFTMARTAGTAGAANSSGGGDPGNAGGAGATGAATIGTGGGGTGGTYADSGTSNSGVGGPGGAFSSGGGTGAATGGNARTSSAGGYGKGSGGDCGGPGWGGCSAGYGGLAAGIIWLVVGGTLTITGTVSATGGNGANGSGALGGGGGGAGGGAVMILHAGSLSNSGTVSAAGGSAGTGKLIPGGAHGGAGGAGGTHIAQVSGAPQYQNLTLVSNTQTAQAVPSTGRLMIFEEASTGSTTINTDIKGWVSRDNGSNYDQVTLSSAGTYAAGKRILEGSVDFTMASGTNMRYKITTHNQSTSKVTRVHGASMLWS